MSGSAEDEVNSNCSKKFRSDEADESSELSGDDSDGFQDMAEDLEDAARQKVICLPEIMDKILGFLDLQSLKQVRLVCKRWLLVAQVHIERKGIVVLRNHGRFRSFVNECWSKIPTLPLPFKDLNLDVDLSYNEGDELDGLVIELLSLPAPLVITRLNTGEVCPNIVIPLIKRLSSSLEYLHLQASAGWEQGEDIHPLDPKQQFPKLRHINVKAWWSIETNGKAKFLTLVPWLVSSSPNIETYEFGESEVFDNEFISALVIQVDIRDVKAFRFLCDSDFSDAARSHLTSIPFRRLEALNLNLPPDATWAEDVLIGVVARSNMTLKKLDLSWAGFEEEEQARFPVCPNVQELRLKWFPVENNFVQTHFPSLQTMTLIWCSSEQSNDGDGLNISIPPFLGLKKLRIQNCNTIKSERYVFKLFANFPCLEYLTIEDSDVRFGCSLVSEWKPKSLNFLKGVKHLVVNNSNDWSCHDFLGWYSLLSYLTGLESIQVEAFRTPEIVTTLPIEELSRLNVIQFRWEDGLNVRKLLQITSRVEKVLISNCCSVLRSKDFLSRTLLKSFFESAPNAQCGCEPTRPKSQWFPEETFVSAVDGYS